METFARTNIILIFQLLAVSQIVQAVDPWIRGLRRLSEDTDWSYSGTLNQQSWGQRYPSCNGARQSPVDIDETFAQVRLQYQNLQLEGWDQRTLETTTITNNGKTVAIAVDGDFYVSGGGLSTRFHVGAITFHWGHCNASSDGSEHSLNGMKYPMEGQIYCYDQERFHSLDQAVMMGGRVAALAVLFEVSLEDNDNLIPIVEAINTVSRFGKSGEVGVFSLRSLLPNNTDKYYIYNGSLSSPPCSETVEWLVFKHTVAISETQLEVFCEVMTMEKAGYAMLTDYLVNNYREQSQQFVGQVFASYTGVEEVLAPTCSSEPVDVQADAQNDTTIVVTWERPRAVYDTTIDWYTVTYQRLQGRRPPRHEFRTDGDQDVGAIIPGLMSNSSYVVQVVAMCNNGLMGRWSDQIIVDMPLEDPDTFSDPVDGTRGPGDNQDAPSEDKLRNAESQNKLNFVPEDQSPVDMTPQEQTRVYQNHPTDHHNLARDQPHIIQNLPIQSSTSSRPKVASELAVQKAQPSRNPRNKLAQNRSKLNQTASGQNWIDKNQKPQHRPFTTSRDSAIWVTMATEQPGFLIPVTQTTTLYRRITQEASISKLPDERRGYGSASPSPALYTPTAEDSQDLDVYYEDGVNSALLEGTTVTTIASAIVDNGVDKEPVMAIPQDHSVSVSRPSHETITSLSFKSWLREKTATPSNTLSNTAYKSPATSFLTRDLVHTTQPMFNEGGFPAERNLPFTDVAQTFSTFKEYVSASVYSNDMLSEKHRTTPLPTTYKHLKEHFSKLDLSPEEVRNTSAKPPSQSSKNSNHTNVLQRMSSATRMFPVEDGLNVSTLDPTHLHDSQEADVSGKMDTSGSGSGFYSNSLRQEWDEVTQIIKTDQSFISRSMDSSKLDTTDSRRNTSERMTNNTVYWTGEETGNKVGENKMGNVTGNPRYPSSNNEADIETRSESSSDSLGYDHGTEAEKAPSAVESVTNVPVKTGTTNAVLSVFGLQEELSGSGDGFHGNRKRENQGNVKKDTESVIFNSPEDVDGDTKKWKADDSIDVGSGFGFENEKDEGGGLQPLSSEGSAIDDHFISTDSVVREEDGESWENSWGNSPEAEDGGSKERDLVFAVSVGTVADYMEEDEGHVEHRGMLSKGENDNKAKPRGVEARDNLRKVFVVGSPALDSVVLVTQSDTNRTTEQRREGSNSSHESRVGLVAGVEREKRTVVPLAVVSSLTILCLLVLVGILIYWRNCFQKANFYLDDTVTPKVISAPSTPLLLSTDGHEALTVKQFVRHVMDLHTTNTFSKEFEIVKESYEGVQACTEDLGITADSSNHPNNKSKNRYINILAYDHSRVKLCYSVDREGNIGDYINANFIDGYERAKAYIAAQGPLRAGREDFWRMIWQQNIGVIVMITNLKEKGRTKCEQYWPGENQEDYGPYQVTLKSNKSLAYYTVRTFSVRDTSTKRAGDHSVVQYHYTQWPDMGAPEYTLPVLSFIQTSSRARRPDMGPVLVHCSAGVGRTGTYIVIDSMLRQIQDQGTVNVLGFLKHVRTQRNFLVQTEEQYVFIHDALVEAILSRDTLVTSDLLHAYVSDLLVPGASGRTRMDKQFKLISQRQAKHADYSTALKDGNAERNRARALMPVERSRVCVTASECNATGYINASYVMGHHHCKEFIVGQTPLNSTVKDFWRMVWEHNTHTLVSLPESHCQSKGEESSVYWPSKDQPISFDGFTVSYSGEEHVSLSNEENLLVQNVTVESTQHDYKLEVRQYSTLCWPNPDSPIRKSFELVSAVREYNTHRERPTVVHDPMGGPTSGLFCALSTLCSQLEEEGAVDVYRVARMTNLMRPGVFNDLEQYQYLYRAVLSLVSSREDERALHSSETNGSVMLGETHIAESLESLM